MYLRYRRETQLLRKASGKSEMDHQTAPFRMTPSYVPMLFRQIKTFTRQCTVITVNSYAPLTYEVKLAL